MKLQVSPLALSTDKGGLYAPRQLILAKVEFMGPAPAEKQKRYNLVFCSHKDDSKD